jgi:hypothetical protein
MRLILCPVFFRFLSPNTGGTLSLDGRNTGQPRTCGYDYFQYDFRGATMGPYCH